MFDQLFKPNSFKLVLNRLATVLLWLSLGLSAQSVPIAKADTCPSPHIWPDGGTLQDAVNNYNCVQLANGTYQLYAPITMPSYHTLTANPSYRDTTILQAYGNWPSNNFEAVVQSPGALNAMGIVISNFTIDSNRLSTLGVAARGITVDNMRIKNGKCTGVSIAGNTQMVIQNSIIELNGSSL